MWAQVIVSSLLMGGVYALVSIGLTLIFGVLRQVNFAHGEFVMVAMYATYWLHEKWQIDPYVAILLVLPLLFLFGVVVERLLLRPLHKAPEASVIFTTLALGTVLQNSAQMLWSANFRSVQIPYLTKGLTLGPVILSYPLVVACLAGLGISLLIYLFLRFTFIGRAILAAAQDRATAELMGVNIGRIFTLTFGMGVACAGVAGALLLPVYSVYPSIGTHFILIAFVVVTIGGLGSLPGAILGGFVVALVGGISSVLMDPGLSPAVYWLVFLGVLLFRPAGLLGLRGTELYK